MSARKKSSTGKIIFSLVIIAILVIAAITNPSKSAAKEEVNTALSEQVDRYINKEMAGEDNSLGARFGSALAKLLTPTLVNTLVDTNVSNYIFFSTFESKVTVINEEKKLASGIILFGNVIPLSSDLKEEKK